MKDNYNEELILRYQQNKNDALLEEIFQNNKYIIKQILSNYNYHYIDDDELMQEGMIGLFHAINSFDNKLGCFPAYAQRCIRNKIISAIRTASGKNNAPLRESISIDEIDEAMLTYNHSPEDSIINDEQLNNATLTLLKELSPLELKVLRLYIDGHSTSDIANSLSLDIKSVHNAMYRIRYKLKTILPQ